MKDLGTRRHRLLAVLCLLMAVVLLPAVASSAATNGASVTALKPIVILRRAVVPQLAPGTIRLGKLLPKARLHLEITLRLPDPRGLEQFVSAVSDRSSPLFHHFLTKGAFARTFGPPLAEVHQVASVMRGLGLEVDSVASDHLSVEVSGDAQAVEAAFHTQIGLYRLPGGRLAYANNKAPMLPAAIASHVETVVGLNDLLRPHSLVAKAPNRPESATAQVPAVSHTLSGTTGPSPCAAASKAASYHGSFTANQLASHYEMTGLYNLGDYGQGVRIGLIEFEPNLASDISAYASCYGISPSVTYHGGGVGKGAGAGEAALDIEDVIGLAPKAAIDVWQGSGSGSSSYQTYSDAISKDVDQVISTSWGLCERDVVAEAGISYLASEKALFEQAAAQGQSVLAAAGDSGSTDCYSDPGSSYPSSLSVDDPGSQPYVVSVGGTSIRPTGETTWSDSAGAGGGGVSLYSCMPVYQDQPSIPGLSNINSVRDTANCSSASPGALRRQVPDVSADADPYTGYTIYHSGQWVSIGGTSAAAPLWAAVAALVDASPFCADYGSGPAGVQPVGLYRTASTHESYIYRSSAVVPEALHDVTVGTNDFRTSGYVGGLYPAGPGYDMASGLGTPVVSGLNTMGKPSTFYPGLAALMCFAYAKPGNSSTKIDSVRPDVGVTTGSTAVTISGSGFLPIAGADELKLGSKTVAAKCSSSSSCTALLPPSLPGPVDLSMLVEDLTKSPLSTADRFTYETMPTVAMSGPKLRYRLPSAITASYSPIGPSSSPVVSYDVRFADAKWSSAHLGAEIYPKAWQKTAYRSVHLTGRPGFRYCISARARVQVGLITAWSPLSCTVLPLGAGSLRPVTTGWTRHTAKSFYLDSAFVTKKLGATLRLAGVEGDQLAPVVTKCAGCGVLGVFVNGKLVKRIGTASVKTHHRVVVVLAHMQLRKATVLLRELTKNRPVIIEGLGVG
jgi:hypothetical protein